MSPVLGSVLIAVLLALLISLGARRGQPAPPDPVSGPLTRELAAFRHDLDAGELDPAEHDRVREHLAARLALQERAASRSHRAGGRRWAIAGLLAAGVIAVTLVPALRERAPGQTAAGNEQLTGEPTVPGLSEWRGAEQALRAGDLRRSVRNYRLAVALAPESSLLRARFGFALARLGRREEALVQLRLAAREDPELAVARIYYGAALLAAGRRRAALAQWGEALRLEPRGPQARLVRRLVREGASSPG